MTGMVGRLQWQEKSFKSFEWGLGFTGWRQLQGIAIELFLSRLRALQILHRASGRSLVDTQAMLKEIMSYMYACIARHHEMVDCQTLSGIRHSCN